MTIRVAQVGTGNAGRLTLRQLIDDDRFELVAVCVSSSADKVGRGRRRARRARRDHRRRRGR